MMLAGLALYGLGCVGLGGGWATGFASGWWLGCIQAGLALAGVVLVVAST